MFRLVLIAVLVAAPLSADDGVHPESPYAMEVVDHGLPEVLDAGAAVEVEVVLRNRGQRAWAGDRGFSVSYHWLSEGGEIADWEGIRTAFESVVHSGDEVRSRVRILAPVAPGEYLLQWDVVEDGVCWISERQPAPQPAVPVRIRRSHAFDLRPEAMPRGGWVGSQRVVRARLHNDGELPWPADGTVSVAYHWYDVDARVQDWEGRRTPIRRLVAPGETIAVDVTIDLPDLPGRAILRWDMVEDGVCWFSERGALQGPPYVIVVAPGPYIAPSAVVVALVLVAVLAWVLMGWPGSRWLAGAALVGDVLWLGTSLFFKQWAVLQAAGEWPGENAVCSAAAGIAVAMLALLAVPRRARPWAAWLLALFATFILAADILHQRFFGDIVSLASLGSAGQAGEVRESIRSLMVAGDLWLWADLVVGLLLALLVWRLNRRETAAKRRTPAMALVVFVAVASVPLLEVLNTAPKTFGQVFRNLYVARDIGVLNFHAYDVLSAGVRAVLRGDLDDSEYREVLRYFADRADQRAGSGPLFGAARGKNLLMVQVESLQGFVPGLQVHGQEITPNLNRWLQSSLHFEQAYDQTEQGRSSDCEILTQVSLLPQRSGAAAFLHGDNRFTGVAAILGERGYTTVSAVPFDGTFWNRRITHPAFGYSRSLFEQSFAPGETIGWGLNDRDFLSQMVPVLSSLQRPFCVWMITLSLHHPFVGFPAAHKQLKVGEWEGAPAGNYLHTMHFFDSAWGAFLAALEAEGLLDDTVVVLWGDHDAGFEWVPEIARMMGSRPDPAGWYASQRVPLALHVPGEPSLRGRSDIPAGQVDVAPTVLALLGVDPAPYAFLGRNLLGRPGDGPVVGEYQCWADGEHIYLQGGPRLMDGSCLQRRTLEPCATGDCAVGFQEAVKQVQISQAVLVHDLQQRVYLENASTQQ